LAFNFNFNFAGLARHGHSLFCFAKKVSKKGDRKAAALRVPAETVAQTGNETNSLRSDKFHFFSVCTTASTAAPERDSTSKATSTATSTATATATHQNYHTLIRIYPTSRPDENPIRNNAI
jgi:hypothetical protein